MKFIKTIERSGNYNLFVEVQLNNQGHLTDTMQHLVIVSCKQYNLGKQLMCTTDELLVTIDTLVNKVTYEVSELKDDFTIAIRTLNNEGFSSFKGK